LQDAVETAKSAWHLKKNGMYVSNALITTIYS